ncbi:DHH phosphoesterase [Jackrogersella minutella]|nr:DHH phosphoesterase [Jackrogersella minutella]
MPPQKSLQAFLATARAALKGPASKRSTPLHFVVGNESADLDSLCSTLFLAYFRSHVPPHTLHIPLCHLARDDLSLRPEFSAVLRHAAVLEDDVLTLSELPARDDLKPGDTRWVLVDHNVMTGALGEAYGDRVVGCIDHHDDEGQVPRDAEPRVIEKCGSCMSLTVEHCQQVWETLSQGDDASREVNAQLALLALAPILVDTTNLGNKDKTTPHDTRAVAVAESRISSAARTSSSSSSSSADRAYDRAGFFADVAALKEDLSHLSPRDVLRKDYKEWAEGSARLGTSSVPQSFAALVRKAGGEGALARVLEGWGAERGVDVSVVLTTCKEGGSFQRELLVWVRGGEGLVTAVKRFVEGEGGERLGLRAWGEGGLDEDVEGSWRRCWVQGTLEYSRKQIAPMLREVLKGVVKE